jgi:hypothetical protein
MPLLPHSNSSVPAVRLATFDSSDALREVGSGYALPVINLEHLRTHEGRLFTAGRLWDSTAKISNNAFADIAFTTTSTSGPHAILDVQVGGDCEVYVYEDAVITGGTTITPFNRNRRSAATSTTTVVHTPTITSPGTLLEAVFAPGGTGHKAGGGSGGFAGEFVTQFSKTYLVRVKNVSGSAQIVQTNIWLYE